MRYLNPNIKALHNFLKLIFLYTLYFKRKIIDFNQAFEDNMNYAKRLIHTLMAAAGLLVAGSTFAVNDMVGGRIDASFGAFPVLSPYFQTGRAKPLLMISPRRSALLPDIPALGETVKGVEAAVIAGVLAPAATPRPIVNRLHQELVKTLAAAEFKERFASVGATVVGSTPEEFAAHLRQETATMAKVIREAGIRIE